MSKKDDGALDLFAEPAPPPPRALGIREVKMEAHFSKANAGLYWVRIVFTDGSHTSANLMNKAQAEALARACEAARAREQEEEEFLG